MTSQEAGGAQTPRGAGNSPAKRPTPTQLAWLEHGESQPGGKLPLFDSQGKRIDSRTVRTCIAQGWAEPWVANPIKPDWEVCRLTQAGRDALKQGRGQ